MGSLAVKPDKENEIAQLEQPKSGLYLSADKETLFVTFKNKQSADTTACLNLLQNMLLISKAAKEVIAKGAKAPKKFEKTRRIRADINTYVNREKVSEENINEIISLIRDGKIRKIKTVLNEKERILNFRTDVARLLVDILAGK